MEEAVATKPGSRTALMRAALALNRPQYVTIRTALGQAKILVPHMGILEIVWKLWAEKRALGEETPGVSIKEVSEGASRLSLDVPGVLLKLRKNGLVRAVRTHKGWASNFVRYFPTDFGIQVLGVVQIMGPGSSVRIGRTASAWESRAKDEPENFFRHAAFLRGNS